jgi:hypothetical protein
MTAVGGVCPGADELCRDERRLFLQVTSESRRCSIDLRVWDECHHEPCIKQQEPLQATDHTPSLDKHIVNTVRKKSIRHTQEIVMSKIVSIEIRHKRSSQPRVERRAETCRYLRQASAPGC